MSQLIPFIFSSGIWLGEGEISLKNSLEALKFYTKWTIAQKDEQTTEAVQIVEIQGVKERVINSFIFIAQKEHSFKVILTNEDLNQIEGEGHYSDQKIDWRFKNQESLVGFESYEWIENGELFLHAEYGLESEYCSVIKGQLWKKSN